MNLTKRCEPRPAGRPTAGDRAGNPPGPAGLGEAIWARPWPGWVVFPLIILAALLGWLVAGLVAYAVALAARAVAQDVAGLLDRMVALAALRTGGGP